MIRPLEDERHLADARSATRAVIYKHSPRCGVCVAAEREVRGFVEGHPDIPVYWLDVIGHRALSQTIARLLDVPHESPQIILLADGQAVWSASHWDVRAQDLEERAGDASAR